MSCQLFSPQYHRDLDDASDDRVELHNHELAHNSQEQLKMDQEVQTQLGLSLEMNLCHGLGNNITSIDTPSKKARKLSVGKNNNEVGRRIWDKKLSCLYCGKLVSKMARHLEQCHKTEIEIARIISLKKNPLSG